MSDETIGHIDPTKERFAQFKDLPRDEPVHMLNLVRLKAEAAYPDGRKATGLEAYRAAKVGRSSAGWEAGSTGSGVPTSF